MITDRTAQEVELAKLYRKMLIAGQTPPTGFLNTMRRGFFELTTLNRIRRAQVTLATRLNKYIYSVHIDTNDSSWDYSDILENGDYYKIINNTKKLESAFFSYPTSPKCPENILNWDRMNKFEKLLEDMSNAVTDMENNFRYCGTTTCGGSDL